MRSCVQNQQHPRFPTKFMSSFFNGEQPPLPVIALEPLLLLLNIFKLNYEPTSVAGKAARAQITANCAMDTGLFSQLPACLHECYCIGQKQLVTINPPGGDEWFGV